MNELVIILFTTVLAIELFLRLPFLATFYESVKVARRALGVIQAKSMSEHRKELVLPRYSILMMRCSLKLLAYTLVIVAFVLLIEVLCRPIEISVVSALSTWPGVSASLLVSVVYIFLRRRMAA